jgi:hypothetical protein
MAPDQLMYDTVSSPIDNMWSELHINFLLTHVSRIQQLLLVT